MDESVDPLVVHLNKSIDVIQLDKSIYAFVQRGESIYAVVQPDLSVDDFVQLDELVDVPLDK